MLRLIALFKFLKAGLLIALGFGTFRLLHKDVGGFVEHFGGALRVGPANHFIELALSKVANLSPAQITKLGLVSFVYAGLFLTEGVGLWLLKQWAEWLTIIITSSLVPLEIYEIHRHPTTAKCGALAVNVAIVVYLIYHVRSRKSEAH